MNEEKKRVQEHSASMHYGSGVMHYTTQYCGEIFRQNMVSDGSVLELGPAEGDMTDILYPVFSTDYTVVDGADEFVTEIKNRYQNIKGEACLFEDFRPEGGYDNIVLGHVLEHVIDPVDILKRCRTWLNGDGRILAAVPNSESLHRQAAVLMGMLSNTKQLNKTDEKNGHRRVYDLNTLKKDFNEAGLRIIKTGGYWLKPLSNGQIDATWNHDMVNAFLKLGEKYPEIAGEIYIVAGR